MAIVVFGRDERACMGCRGTKRFFRQHGVAYEFRNVDEDPEADAHVRSLGALQVPVVQVDGGAWFSGYSPDRLKELVALDRAPAA